MNYLSTRGILAQLIGTNFTDPIPIEKNGCNARISFVALFAECNMLVLVVEYFSFCLVVNQSKSLLQSRLKLVKYLVRVRLSLRWLHRDTETRAQILKVRCPNDAAETGSYFLNPERFFPRRFFDLLFRLLFGLFLCHCGFPFLINGGVHICSPISLR